MEKQPRAHRHLRPCPQEGYVSDQGPELRARDPSWRRLPAGDQARLLQSHAGQGSRSPPPLASPGHQPDMEEPRSHRPAAPRQGRAAVGLQLHTSQETERRQALRGRSRSGGAPRRRGCRRDAGSSSTRMSGPWAPSVCAGPLQHPATSNRTDQPGSVCHPAACWACGLASPEPQSPARKSTPPSQVEQALAARWSCQSK